MKLSKRVKKELTIAIIEFVAVAGMFGLIGFGILYKLFM